MKTNKKIDFSKDVIMPALFIMVVYMSWAQGTNIDWTNDHPLVKEKKALYSDALRNKDYEAALAPYNWLLDSVPTLSRAFYINGDKLFKALEEQAKDETKKRLYQEKRLSLFDRRLLHFSDEINILNRKALASYNYYKNRPEKYEALYLLYEKVMAMNPKDVMKSNVAAYPYVVGLYKSKGGIVDEKTMIDRYDKLSSIIALKGMDESIQRSADRMLTDQKDLSCSVINTRFGSAFLNDPDDLIKARKIVRLSIANKCADSEVFLQAAKAVHKHAPDGNLAYLIASKSQKIGDVKEASFYYREAVRLIEDKGRKADIYHSMATLFQKRGLMEEARTAARNSLAYNPFSKKSYRLIGDLYFNSAESCKQYKSKTQDRAIYIAAFNMYEKADDKAMMQQAQEQFPSGEEIFGDVLEIGQTVEVGCWVNENVVLQKR